MAINLTINPAPETNINVTSENTSVTMANEKGPQGGIGIQGVQGPAATVSVGTVTGLPAGSTPVVTNVGTSAAAVFNFQLPEAGTPFGDWSVGGYKIINMANPTNPQDAVTKAYADQIASGLNVHDSVDVATTAALTATYVDGTSDASGGLGIGATLTITATGVLTIDGITKVLNDRILVKDQTDAKQNGVYRVSTAGAVGVSAVLTRAEDSNNSVPGELGTGDFIYVQRGTVNGTKAFVMNSTGTSTSPVDGIKIGTDNINYTQFTGLTLSTTTPAALGTAAAGTGTTAARDDHVHPELTGLALTANPLSQFAATTSSQLLGVISDETGSGSLVFGTGPTITPAEGTTTTATSGAGYMGMPQNSSTTGALGIVAGDAGKHIYSSATRTVTIPDNGTVPFPIGTTITFISGPGAVTTIAITTNTMYLSGPGSTGSRTLAAFGMATAVKITSTSWMISGNGLS